MTTAESKAVILAINRSIEILDRVYKKNKKTPNKKAP